MKQNLKILNKSKIFLITMLSVLVSISAYSIQTKQKEGTFVSVKKQVVNKFGNPIVGAIVKCGKTVTYTDNNGNFTISAKMEDFLKIYAKGYFDYVDKVENVVKKEQIVMIKHFAFKQEFQDDSHIFSNLSKKLSVGNDAEISGDVLTKYPDMAIMNGLAGRLSGLYATQASSTPGWNHPSLVVQGLSGFGNNSPLILVDGIERSANELLPEEIESVKVLKDVTSKLFYGSRAVNGVILVTTKRGKANRKGIIVNGEYGRMLPTTSPVEWLDAAEYATLYNQARANDGMSPYYSQQDIDAYSNGTDPVLYPNNDLNNLFLNKSMPINRFVTQFFGGGKMSRYYVNMGYTATGGYENIKEPSDYKKFNVRGNLDVIFSPVTSMKIDIAARVESRRSANITTMDFFGALSSHRPNEYPISFVNSSDPDIILYGGSPLHKNNIYVMGNKTGYGVKQDRNIQMNLGFDFNLNSYIKGLNASFYGSYDDASYYKPGVNEDRATYYVTGSTVGDGGKIDYVTQILKLDNLKYGSTSNLGSGYNHRIGFIGQVEYNRAFAEKHVIDARLFSLVSSFWDVGSKQNDNQVNNGLGLLYIYDGKYIGEFNLAYMGSARVAKDNRFKFFPAAGFGWIMSEEDFLKDISYVDFLKLKTTVGLMGYDGGMSIYDADERWETSGSMGFGLNGNIYTTAVALIHLANPNLNWETSREFNFGLESILLDRHLSVDLSYFNHYRKDIPLVVGALTPDYVGAAPPKTNYGEMKNQGFDGAIVYSKNKGKFTFDIGLNFVYSKSEMLKMNQINYPDNISYLSYIGQPNDAIFGYVADGLLTISDLDSYRTTLGAVKEGDIKYKDLNGDGIIDTKDREMIGKSFPTLSTGIYTSLKYKGFELYVLGVYNCGNDIIKNNNYYQISASGKYSKIARDYWTPATAGTATYPRLSTTNSTNNFVQSTFWMEKGNFFRLKNVEFTYTLPRKILAPTFVNNLKVYIRGTNLLAISNFDDVDPENINSGINNYPLMKCITGGIYLKF